MTYTKLILLQPKKDGPLKIRYEGTEGEYHSSGLFGEALRVDDCVVVLGQNGQPWRAFKEPDDFSRWLLSFGVPVDDSQLKS